MINLNKIKRERGFNQKKDYKTSIIARSNKNKAMIGITSLAIGGGVFVGLLVPGLLPVVLTGAPMMAMSTNIVAAGVAGGAVAGAHYSITSRENKLRKKSKNLAKGYEELANAYIDKENYATHENNAEKQLFKEKYYYEQRKNLLEALERKNANLLERNKASTRLGKKIAKVKSEIYSIEHAYDIARGLYKADIAKLNGTETGTATGAETGTAKNAENVIILPEKTGASNTTAIVPVGPVVDHTDQINKKKLAGKGRKLSALQAKLHNAFKKEKNPVDNSENIAFTTPVASDKVTFGDRAKMFLIGLTGSSKYFIPNGTNTQKMRDLLNVETPTLDENAENYTVDATMHTVPATRVMIEDSSNVELDNADYECKKNEIGEIFDNVDKNALVFDDFVYQNDYNLPIKGGHATIQVEFENTKLQIVYSSIDDYHSSLTKPLIIMTEIVEKLNELREKYGNDATMGKIKIHSSMFDNNGQHVETGLNFDAEIETLKDAVEARNMIYASMLESTYKAQKLAYDKGILGKVAGVDIIQKACDVAIPKANKDKQAILNDVQAVLNGNVDKVFWDGQFVENFDYKQKEATQKVDISKVDVAQTM